MNLMALVVIWAVLATIVIALAIYRAIVSGRVDEMIHVHDAEASMISRQTMIAKKLEVIDRRGKLLTVITVIFGIAILAAYIYEVWQRSGTITAG
jgi:uncharacterized membrane protein